jgi:hypothetical protein
VLSIFQAEFVRGKRMLDNIFIIKTIMDKYLRKKDAEFTGVLWILRKLSIQLIDKPYGLI